MKATFNLTADQLFRALRLTEKVRREMAEYQNYLDGLNKERAAERQPPEPHRLLDCGTYAVEEHGATNPRQEVYLSGGKLIVEGARCALAYDGGFDAAKLILGPGVHVPMKYETSDARLKWDETLREYLWNRRKALAPVIRAIERGNTAQLHAQFTAQEINEGKEVMAATS